VGRFSEFLYPTLSTYIQQIDVCHWNLSRIVLYFEFLVLLVRGDRH